MLFDVTCRTGRLQVDDATVRVVSFGKIMWSTPHESETCIGVTKGAVMADITVYTIDHHYPARFVPKQEAERFLTLFPGVPNSPQLVAQPAAFAASPVPRATGQWQIRMRQSTGPGSRKKPPVWAYIVTGILALAMCGCLGSAVVSGAMGMRLTAAGKKIEPLLQ